MALRSASGRTATKPDRPRQVLDKTPAYARPGGGGDAEDFSDVSLSTTIGGLWVDDLGQPLDYSDGEDDDDDDALM